MNFLQILASLIMTLFTTTLYRVLDFKVLRNSLARAIKSRRLRENGASLHGFRRLKVNRRYFGRGTGRISM